MLMIVILDKISNRRRQVSSLGVGVLESKQRNQRQRDRSKMKTKSKVKRKVELSDWRSPALTANKRGD